MLKNYLTIAIRNLMRHQVYSFINIIGLAVGMACCVLIGLYIHDELNFDRFKNADRIYRVLIEVQTGDQRHIYPLSPTALQRVLEDEFPEVETATKLAHNHTGFIQYANKMSTAGFALTEPDFYRVFDIPLLKGNRENIMQQPSSAVLSQRLTQKLFGEEDPIGKVVTLTRKGFFDGELIVRGVMENISDRSSLGYEILATNFANQLVQQNEQWDSWVTGSGRSTFVLLKPDINANSLKAKLQRVIEQHLASEDSIQKFHLQPLPRIHLYSKEDYSNAEFFGKIGDIQEIYLLGAVAGFILLIACINFINLTTARSARRAQEVGLRKVVGAARFQMITQFMGEAVLLVCLALVIALGLLELSLPYFATYMGKPDLSLGIFDTLQIVFLLASLVLAVAGLAGTYPAFFLSAFKPIETLKGTSAKTGGQWFRKGLVIIQFALSISLIVGTVIVYQQIEFLRSQRLGRDELILTTDFFRLDSRSTADRNKWLVNRYWTIKDAILKHPNISEATVSVFANGTSWGGALISAEGHGDRSFALGRLNVDEDYIPFYNLELVAGRNFSRNASADIPAYILNESAVKMLGWDNPIGKTITWQPRYYGKGQVIGIVKDYPAGRFDQKIRPLMLVMEKGDYCFFSMKLRGENLNETIPFVKKTLSKFSTKPLPATYRFEDEIFNLIYDQELRSSTMVTTFSLLAIFLACLGLLGLATYAAEQRTKEIGVRKVLGASVTGIISLLSKDFVKLVLIANIIAYPVAYYTINRWLQDFVYRIDINMWPFALGTFLALAIALGTVSYQAFKAARANPIDALRYE